MKKPIVSALGAKSFGGNMKTAWRLLGATLLFSIEAACLPGGEEDGNPPSSGPSSTDAMALQDAAAADDVDASASSSLDASQSVRDASSPLSDARTAASDAWTAQPDDGSADCAASASWDEAGLLPFAPIGIKPSCGALRCLNGGLLVENSAPGPRCSCPAGFGGARCETARETISCTTEAAPVPGYCGGLFCNASTARFAAGFDTAGKCGNARDIMCAGTLNAISMQCMINTALSADAIGEATTCIEADQSIVAAQLSDGCIACFVTANECCKQNSTCLSACLLGPGKSCDDAQRDAGCLTALYTCAGMPKSL
jgi:hypothetical protein